MRFSGVAVAGGLEMHSPKIGSYFIPHTPAGTRVVETSKSVHIEYIENSKEKAAYFTIYAILPDLWN